jgi:hypothetical protein
MQQYVRTAAAMELELLSPAALAPYLAGLLAMLVNGDRDERSIRESMERVLRKVVASMPANVVGNVLTVTCAGAHQVQRRKEALDLVISQLPPATLRLHAPLLMSLLLDPSAGVRKRASGLLAKLDPSELATKNPALLLLGLLDPEVTMRTAALYTLCRLPLESLALHAAKVLRMLWDSDGLVRERAMAETERMLKNFQAPALKEQLRRAAVEASVYRRWGARDAAVSSPVRALALGEAHYRRMRF